jgi:hypothetical protein
MQWREGLAYQESPPKQFTDALSCGCRLRRLTDRGCYDLLSAGFAERGIEIFVHNPMAWRLNDREVEERNEDAVVFQAVFREGGKDTRVLFASDVNDVMLGHIVDGGYRSGKTYVSPCPLLDSFKSDQGWP